MPPLTFAAQTAWAKSSYQDDLGTLTWSPLWLHLLDTSAVIDGLAISWAIPSLTQVIADQLGDTDDPIEEFRALTRWIGGLHDIGKLTPAFSSKVPALDDRMCEAGLIHKQREGLNSRDLPHGLAGQDSLVVLLEERGWHTDEQLRSAYSLASVVGAHHGLPPREIDASVARYPYLYGDQAWHAARRELFTLITERTT